jgi:hypothetical protein
MTQTQKGWLKHICYLDKVNRDTLHFMLPHEDSTQIMKWFENNASVRDVKSEDYTVTPYIRHMLLEYNRINEGPQTHLKREACASAAMRQSYPELS